MSQHQAIKLFYIPTIEDHKLYLEAWTPQKSLIAAADLTESWPSLLRVKGHLSTASHKDWKQGNRRYLWTKPNTPTNSSKAPRWIGCVTCASPVHKHQCKDSRDMCWNNFLMINSHHSEVGMLLICFVLHHRWLFHYLTTTIFPWPFPPWPVPRPFAVRPSTEVHEASIPAELVVEQTLFKQLCITVQVAALHFMHRIDFMLKKQIEQIEACCCIFFSL